jgi:hypothetical protein
MTTLVSIEIKETSPNGPGSKDPEPAGSPGVGVAAESQLPEASQAPESQGGTNSATASQLPEADSRPVPSKLLYLGTVRHF